MEGKRAVSRRGFVGGLATAVGYLTLRPPADLLAHGIPGPLFQQGTDAYDALAKLAFNENPYGPSESAMRAMTRAFKYANRYGYPDGDIADEIARHHGVPRENIMLGAGSGEILSVVGLAFLQGGRKVVGVEPTYSQVYSHASGIKADVIRLPLLDDFRQDMPATIAAVKRHHRDVGFVYLCNPNNPTGRIIPAREIKQLLDAIPEDVVVLVDEAYHHYVQDPTYATSVPHVLEGRNVIVARTFSKIYGMAAMRLGYAVAPRELIQRMRPWSTGSINALVRWGGVAALADTESEARVRRTTIDLRERTVADLKAMGYSTIPSETNFFMLHLRRPVQPVIQEFRTRGVAVGRPFPPLTEHLRVSVGTAEEMRRFMTAFREIMATPATATRGG
ncbi:MAG TPA: histidinol-phosphate transaminase [Gemmatimonadaceae bacterium]|nr:histidinol-phosphate transaminase [Gemmatimonadaceae bacterium]